VSIVENALNRLKAGAPASPSRRVFGTVIKPTAQQPKTGPAISIDRAALSAAGLLPPKHQEMEIGSQYRKIKRPLISLALGRGREAVPNGRLIMVASALSGEGKTFTTLNVAFSMALEEELRVVLVDADVINPQISRMFAVAGERGLLDAVSDSTVDCESLILPTDVPNLFLLPAGTKSERATELLASERMAEVMNRLLSTDSNRIFLFDSSPLLQTTEAHVLAEVAGQVVVVVRAEQTEERNFLEAISRVPQGRSVSLILNQSRLQNTGEYYYGYAAPENE
jgi:protein-tyrosine kinase